jgi:hypothetical protein
MDDEEKIPGGVGSISKCSMQAAGEWQGRLGFDKDHYGVSVRAV